jgi:predicted nucleotidyltransferase
MSEFDPRAILERLSARGVDYIVVGAVAARLFGTTRLTDDLDICYSTEKGNLRALGEVLIALEARLAGVDDQVPFVPDERTLARVQILTLETVYGRFDLMTQPEGGPTYRELKRRAETVDIGTTSVLVASLDDLIAMKEAVGRDKDLLDAKELRKARRLRRQTGSPRG